MTAPSPTVAAVTGASRGIGRATASRLARRGYRVFALARSRADLDDLGRREGVETVAMDIADAGSRDGAVAAIFEATGGYGVDVLVNNAGYGQLGPLEEVEANLLSRQLEVNVVGLLAFTQPFLPGMRARGAGRIVNISSVAGRIAAPFMGAYNASKFALEGMSDALRVELAPFGVRVILIEPGPIRTDFGRAADETRRESAGSPYWPLLHRWQTARGGSDLLARSPEAVARVIQRAIEARYPRPRYTLTVQAKGAILARRLVPDMVQDWAFARILGRVDRQDQGR